MSIWSETAEEKRRRALFNGPQKDPTAIHAQRGMPYHARRSITRQGGRVLMPDDFMPFGEHSGKHLRAVPADYLRWIDAQPWAATWHRWQPVRDYLQRFPLPEAPLPAITITVDAVRMHPEFSSTFREGSSRLYVTQDADMPYLHAFAHGALSLWRQWFRPADANAPPHYLLTPAAQQLAIDLGATLVTSRVSAADAADWSKTHGPATPANPAGHQFYREMPDGTTRCTKRCYISENDALCSLDYWKKTPRGLRNRRIPHLRAHECPVCGFWHLTSKPDQSAKVPRP